jgi:hypothetical protein
MRSTRIFNNSLWSGVLVAALSAFAVNASEQDEAFIPRLVNSSTIPSNGDLNPYGVAFVPKGFPTDGAVHSGDVLVSNFNNSSNLQGTGTTIIKFSPDGAIAPPGSAEVFFTSQLIGLTTALGVLRAGFVIVGNVPTATTNGVTTVTGPGALQVIDRHGNIVQTWKDSTLLDGPWDLTIDDDGSQAHIFVSNVLNGTVSRLDVSVAAGKVTLLKKTLIATGYGFRTDPAALVVGPTGLALDERTGILFVASTADNAIYSISGAVRATTAVNKGSLVFSDTHLRGPLAMRFAPNGDLLTANGDAVNADPLHPSEIVEFTKFGHFVAEYNVDATQGGAFGLDTRLGQQEGFNYAVIDDVTNNLSVYRLPAEH